MQHNRAVEFRVWYKSIHGGSLMEVARTDDQLRVIRTRLDKRKLHYRIQRYIFVC